MFVMYVVCTKSIVYIQSVDVFTPLVIYSNKLYWCTIHTYAREM